MRKSLFLLILPALIPVSASNLDLATAIQLMTNHNPSLKRFKLKQSALDGATYTASLKPALQIDVEAENFLGSNDFNGFSQNELSISISSVIELGGKKNQRLNLLSSKKQLLEAQQYTKSLDLISQLTKSFIRLLATQERIKLAAESVQLINDTYESVKTKAAAGAVSDAEVTRSLAALKQAQLIHRSEQHTFESQKVALSLFWAEKHPRFDSVSGELFYFKTLKDMDSLMNHVEKSSLANVLIVKQRLAESKLRLTQAQSKSNLNWSIGMRYFEETNDTAFTAGLSMPLFQSKRNSGALREARANVEQLIYQQQNTALELYAQLYEFYMLRKLDKTKFHTFKDEIIPALSTALELTKNAYQEGRYGYLEYKAARQELIEAKKTLIDTAENILIYGVEIEQMTAQPIYIKNQ